MKSVEYCRMRLSSSVNKLCCCCFCFGEKGCLSSRDVPWQKRFANGKELSQPQGLQRTHLLHVGEPARSSGWCWWRWIRQQRELQAESGASATAPRCGQRWLCEAVVYRLPTFLSPCSPLHNLQRARSVLYLVGYFKGICCQNFSLMATCS